MSNEVTEWIKELWCEVKSIPSGFKTHFLNLVNKVKDYNAKINMEINKGVEAKMLINESKAKKKKLVVNRRETIIINKGSSLTNLLLLYLCILNTLVVIAVFSTLLIVNAELPVNELTYYTNRAVNFLQRCDGVDCADRLIAWIESDFPLNPELPDACGRIINGTAVIVEDCSQW